jgi:hypothetical protein
MKRIMITLLASIVFTTVMAVEKELPENNCKDGERAIYIRQSFDRQKNVVPAHFKCLRFDVETVNLTLSSNVEKMKKMILDAQHAK